MARWKARAEFLLRVVELLFLSLTVEAKRVKTRCLQEGVGQFEPRFQGEGIVPGEYFFLISTKLDTFCYLTVQTTVLHAVVLTQYRRVTDGRTDRQTELP